MKYSLLTIALLGSMTLAAQTKMIAHKSHGGSSADFFTRLAAADELLAESDFGLGDMDMEERISRLDSVHLRPDGSVRTFTTFRTYRPYDPEPRDTTDWQSDFIDYDSHPLFNQQNSLEIIKQQLDRHYGFINPAEEVLFMGFEQEEVPAVDPQQQPQSSAPSPLGTKKQTQKSDNGQGQEDLAEQALANTTPELKQAAASSEHHFNFLWLALLGILALGGRWAIKA